MLKVAENQIKYRLHERCNQTDCRSGVRHQRMLRCEDARSVDSPSMCCRRAPEFGRLVSRSRPTPSVRLRSFAPRHRVSRPIETQTVVQEPRCRLSGSVIVSGPTPASSRKNSRYPSTEVTGSCCSTMGARLSISLESRGVGRIAPGRVVQRYALFVAMRQALSVTTVVTRGRPSLLRRRGG